MQVNICGEGTVNDPTSQKWIVKLHTDFLLNEAS